MVHGLKIHQLFTIAICFLLVIFNLVSGGVFKNNYPDFGTRWMVAPDTMNEDRECISGINDYQFEYTEKRIKPMILGITQVWAGMYKAMPINRLQPHPGLLVSRLTIKHGKITDLTFVRNTMNYAELEKEVGKRLLATKLRKLKNIQCTTILVSIEFTLDVRSDENEEE